MWTIWLFKGALIIVLLGGAVFGVHTYNAHQQDIGYQRGVSEYQAKLIEAQESARKTEANFNQKIKEANDAANRRNKQIDAAHAAAQSAADSLRDTLANLRDSVPGATAATLAESVRVLANVLGTCSQRYTDVAGVSDRCISEAKRCVEGWPSYDKITPPK